MPAVMRMTCSLPMPNLSQYISSLLEGVSEAPGFSWNAFLRGHRP